MKISYNWLRKFIDTGLSAEEAGKLLTDCGLEVESITAFGAVEGGLEGMVIGEVLTKEKHPDADRLSVTTVNIGQGEPLNIVCGAANVAVGQKVVIATIGATLYPTGGESFKIKKSKIRGALSEGMICAEDEIGLGTSHEGIMVLPADTPVGMKAADYFKLENDYVLEIGLTPNRADAMSHLGVARDLAAVLNAQGKAVQLKKYSTADFKTDNTNGKIEVVVEDAAACPRYAGVVISDIKVQASPDWLQQKLKAIGLRPINNVVDVTNYIQHELGQPLHAFDLAEIKGKKVVVKKLTQGTKFTTLDGVERELSSDDLMICNAEEGMCIAGVFGGAKSGVSEKTTGIFLESAYFNPVSVRKTARRHGLNTDASFRFERGVDPNITADALKRAALLIQEVAGGKVSSDVTDIYPSPIKDFAIDFTYTNCKRLIGKDIPKETIKTILQSLDIKIAKEDGDKLNLLVAPYRVDVQREADIIEEILRIYGYNNIELPERMQSSISYAPKPDREAMQQLVSNLLAASGLTEIMSNSLGRADYLKLIEGADKITAVNILNPLSSELDTMRTSLLFGGLEAIARNSNRQRPDLKLFEFGKVYYKTDKGYKEDLQLGIFITGRKKAEGWNSGNDKADVYSIKATVQKILSRFNLNSYAVEEIQNAELSAGLEYKIGKKTVAKAGEVKASILKKLDVDAPVFYACFDWEILVQEAASSKTIYKELPKFPEVRRDLALLLDKQIKFSELEKLAYESERKLLKKVNLFDVYEGKNIAEGKKSYAISYTLQDTEKTLTDTQIEAIMSKLIKTYEEKLGASVRA